MSRRLPLRAVTPEEATQIRQLAASRKAPQMLVQRARVIQALLDMPTRTAAEASQMAGYRSAAAGRRWITRFNAQGLVGLRDHARAGRPVVHAQHVRSRLIHLAVHKPPTLGYPFALWTLARLQCAFEERYHLRLSDSTIWEWLAAEGLHWKRQQSWFHDVARHDPEFVEKRGPSFRRISPRPPAPG